MAEHGIEEKTCIPSKAARWPISTWDTRRVFPVADVTSATPVPAHAPSCARRGAARRPLRQFFTIGRGGPGRYVDGRPAEEIDGEALAGSPSSEERRHLGLAEAITCILPHPARRADAGRFAPPEAGRGRSRGPAPGGDDPLFTIIQHRCRDCAGAEVVINRSGGGLRTHPISRSLDVWPAGRRDVVGGSPTRRDDPGRPGIRLHRSAPECNALTNQQRRSTP
jgi:hypothetical protein